MIVTAVRKNLETENYAEYKIHEESPWLPSGYCTVCTGELVKSQWGTYVELVGKETCRAALLRLVDACPLTLSDWVALPCPVHGKPIDPKAKLKKEDKDKEKDKKDQKEPCPTRGQVLQLWTASSNSISVPTLTGAKTGKDREVYLADLCEFAKLLKDTEAEES